MSLTVLAKRRVVLRKSLGFNIYWNVISNRMNTTKISFVVLSMLCENGVLKLNNILGGT
jgi:hypothetical protein